MAAHVEQKSCPFPPEVNLSTDAVQFERPTIQDRPVAMGGVSFSGSMGLSGFSGLGAGGAPGGASHDSEKEKAAPESGDSHLVLLVVILSCVVILLLAFPATKKVVVYRQEGPGAVGAADGHYNAKVAAADGGDFGLPDIDMGLEEQ